MTSISWSAPKRHARLGSCARTTFTLPSWWGKGLPRRPLPRVYFRSERGCIFAWALASSPSKGGTSAPTWTTSSCLTVSLTPGRRCARPTRPALHGRTASSSRSPITPSYTLGGLSPGPFCSVPFARFVSIPSPPGATGKKRSSAACLRRGGGRGRHSMAPGWNWNVFAQRWCRRRGMWKRRGWRRGARG